MARRTIEAHYLLVSFERAHQSLLQPIEVHMEARQQPGGLGCNVWGHRLHFTAEDIARYDLHVSPYRLPRVLILA